MCFSVKRPSSASSPKCDRLFAFFTLQFGGDDKKSAEHHSAFIVGEFDKSSFLNQAAKLD